MNIYYKFIIIRYTLLYFDIYVYKYCTFFMLNIKDIFISNEINIYDNINFVDMTFLLKKKIIHYKLLVFLAFLFSRAWKLYIFI